MPTKANSYAWLVIILGDHSMTGTGNFPLVHIQRGLVFEYRESGVHYTGSNRCALESTEFELSNALRINFISHFFDYIFWNENTTFWEITEKY